MKNLNIIYAILLLLASLYYFYTGQKVEGILLVIMIHMLYIEEKIDNLNK